MARLIVKSPYIKCGAGQSAGGYLEYIATRERVEIIPDDRPPTQKQTQLIAKLVKDFPDAKELMDTGAITYVQYVPNGSVFFTEEGLLEYIAECTHKATPTEKRNTYRKTWTPKV